MIDRAGAKLAEKLLGPETPQILYDEGPQVQHVVSRHSVSLLHHHDLGTQQLGLDGRSHAAWSATNDQHLHKERVYKSVHSLECTLLDVLTLVLRHALPRL